MHLTFIFSAHQYYLMLILVSKKRGMSIPAQRRLTLLTAIGCCRFTGSWQATGSKKNHGRSKSRAQLEDGPRATWRRKAKARMQATADGNGRVVSRVLRREEHCILHNLAAQSKHPYVSAHAFRAYTTCTIRVSESLQTAAHCSFCPSL
jgi:hypothetical protein